MERIRTLRTNPVIELGPWRMIASVLLIALAANPAQAQFGSPSNYTIRVVDQSGRSLDGSKVHFVGSSEEMITPATFTTDPGPQLFAVSPAFQGAMFPGGSHVPEAPNGLERAEMVFLDPMGGDVTIEWRTADATVSVVDQNGAAVSGGAWGFAGGSAFYAAGSIVAPVTDESVYPTLVGPSIDGWSFVAQAAFDGQAIDLSRAETREVDATTSALSFTWRQVSCTMGVVDATGAPIRGATWTMFGHTFAAGDAIVLPVTEDGSGAVLSGAYAAGLPAALFTNTASGSGPGTFEVLDDGTLSPAFVDVNGASFGLRCGVSPFPPITNGTLEGAVLADGAPKSGVSVLVSDANGGSASLVTDGAGAFRLDDVPQGVALVTLAMPAGFHAVNPASGSQSVTIVAGATARADFAIAADIAPPPLVNQPESSSYWAKEVRVAQRGHGNHNEAFKDMRETYPLWIFEQFANHPSDPVRVQGVTQVDPDGNGPAPARRLELADMDVTLQPGNSSALVAAKRELLVVLLNVVSNRLSLALIVDERGTTLEQEIRRIAAMINDGKAANDHVAKNHANRINAGRAGGRFGGYRSDDPGTGLNDPMPVVDAVVAGPRLSAVRDGYGSGVRLTFALANPGSATLDVFDAMGRHVERLYEGTAPAGTTVVTWSRGSARPGVYFARLVSGEGAAAVKLVAAQ